MNRKSCGAYSGSKLPLVLSCNLMLSEPVKVLSSIRIVQTSTLGPIQHLYTGFSGRVAGYSTHNKATV